MHGAHRIRNALRGADHPHYRNGERTQESEEAHRKSSVILLTLRDLGDHLRIFSGDHPRGRKPNGYKRFDMNDPEELSKAILATLREKEE
jgi:hypothetical protein